jgi:hypothetical protein
MNYNSLALALAYLLRYPNRYLFPIKAGAKYPPLVKDNLAGNASNDPEQIKKWVKQFTRKDGVGPNWGVALKKSGLFVVDIDCNQAKGKVGQKTFDDLDLMYGFPETEKVVTPSGGFHLYYEGEHQFALGVYGLGQDIDSPNYILIAGCQFDDGTSYVRVNDNIPTAPKPEWFADVIKSAKKERVENASEAVVDLDKPAQIAWARDYLINDAEPAIEGKGGEQTTFKVACSLAENGISEGMAFDMMMEFYNVEFVCEPLWEPEDLRKKIGNAYTYASLAQRGGKTAEAEFGGDDIAAIAASIPPEIMGNPTKRAEQERAKADTKQIEEERAAEDTDETREKFFTKPEVIRDWVWVSGIERFIKLSDTKDMWKRSAFESHFSYLAPKKKTFCDSLLSTTTGTIRRFAKIGFFPGQPRFLGNGEFFNTYTPSPIVPAPGDTAFWDDHLAYLFPNERDRNLLLDWLGWFVQNLALKPKHALLLQGHIQGTGKTFIPKMLSEIIGKQNVAPIGQTQLTNQFNGWALRSKLLVIEELRAVERGEVKNKLHDMITEEMISVNEKNVPQKEAENCFGMIAMTNDDAAISLEDSDRRYLVLRTDADPRSEEYYTTLYRKLEDPAAVAAVAYALMKRDLGAYDGRGKAPFTEAKRQMINAGLSDLEHHMMDNQGTWPLNGRVIQVKDVMDTMPNRLTGKSGRAHATIAAVLRKRYRGVEVGRFKLKDGSQARLWVINGSAITNIEGWQDQIAAIYEKDRAKAGSGSAGSAEDDFGVG